MRAWAGNEQGNLSEISTCFSLSLEIDNSRACQSRPRYTNYPVVWLSLVGLTVLNSLSPGYLLVATAELAVFTMCWCCLIVLQVSCSRHTAYLFHGVHGSWNFTITNMLLPIRFYLLYSSIACKILSPKPRALLRFQSLRVGWWKGVLNSFL